MNSCGLSTAFCPEVNVYRLSREPYARDLSGFGAALRGGRWNSRGVPMLYTAESRALALAEVAVHLMWATLPKDYMLVTLCVPEVLKMAILNGADLPEDWRAFPHPASTQRIGDAWVRSGETAAMRVPSAVVAGDCTVLLNPAHPDMRGVEVVSVEPFPPDSRHFR